MPFKAVVHPKCPRCDKAAYPAESVKVTIGTELLTYHIACFKCCECQLKLTLKTYKVSDFGDPEVFCQKCVPKQAPSQTSESIETDRTRKAAALFRDVGMVNEQKRGAAETVGKGASGSTSAEAERLAGNTALNREVGMKNEQVSRLYEKAPGTPEVVRSTPGKFKPNGAAPEAISLYQRLGQNDRVQKETYPVGSTASKEATEEFVRTKLLAKTLESDLEGMKIKCASLETQLAAANEKVETLEADKASSAASDFAAKKARNASIKRSKEAGLDEVATQAAADASANAAAEAAAEVAAEASAAKSQAEAELARTAAKVDELTAQLESANAKLASETARADAAANGYTAAAAAADANASDAQQLLTLTAANVDLQAKVVDLEGKYNASQEALAALAGGGGCCTVS